MAFIIPEALKRIQNPFMQFVARSVITTDEMSGLIPFEAVAGTGFRYNREGTLPVGGAFLADTASTATEESIGTDDVVSVEFRRIVGHMDLDALAQVGGGSTPQEKKNRLLQKKIKATWRKVQDAMINGSRITSVTVDNATVTPGLAIDAVVVGPNQDTTRQGPATIRYTHTGTFYAYRAPGDVEFGANVAITADGSATLYSHNPSKWVTITVDVSDATANGQVNLTFVSSTNTFEGLETLIASSQTLGSTTTGLAYTLAVLDALIAKNKVPQGRVFMMNSTALQKHFAVLRTLYGTDATTVTIPGYGSQVPTYRGIPILVNDFILGDETDAGSNLSSSIYLLSLTPDEGVYLAGTSYGSIEAPDADPRVRPVGGWQIEDIGPLEGSDAHRTRVKWIGALCVGSDYAAARYRCILPT